MTKTNYSFKNFDNHTVKAYGKDLGISTKVAVNIAKKIRGMNALKAIIYLDSVSKLKLAVPFTKFNDGVGHRRGNMASGRFPVKASIAIAGVINSAISNAANQNLSDDLVIEHIVVNKAANRFHYGRQRRRAMKSTHVEVVLREVETKAPKKTTVNKSTEKSKSDSKSTKAKVTEKVTKEETKISQKPKVEKVENPKTNSSSIDKPKAVDGETKK